MATVQASGPDYPDVLARALESPDVGDEDGDTLKVSSGGLAVSQRAGWPGRTQSGQEITSVRDGGE